MNSQAVHQRHRELDLSPVEAMELLLSKMAKTKGNAEFLSSMANGKG